MTHPITCPFCAQREEELVKLQEQLAAREARIKKMIGCKCYQINDPDSDYHGCSCDGGCPCHDIVLQDSLYLREHDARLLEEMAFQYEACYSRLVPLTFENIAKTLREEAAARRQK